MTDDVETRRLLARAIHEALEAYVTPEVSQSLLRDALSRSRLEQPPSSGGQARRFLSRGLRPALTEALGPEVADLVISEIERTVDLFARRQTRPVPPRAATSAPPASGERAARHTRPRGSTTLEAPVERAPAGTERTSVTAQVEAAAPSTRARAGAEPVIRPHMRTEAPITARARTAPHYFRRVADSVSMGRRIEILAVTTDAELLSALSRVVGERGVLRTVRSVFALVHALEPPPDGRRYVLVDAATPSIKPAAVAALADEMGSAEVVLCRASTDQVILLGEVSERTHDWIRLGAGQDALGVAQDCALLVS